MKLAAIDIGTNSTRLLISSTIGPYRQDLYRSATITRLGEGLGETGRIKREAAERTLSAVENYVALIREFGVGEVRAVATSAARNAANAKEFKKAFKRKFGFDFKILTGDEEAKLSFNGAVVESGLTKPGEKALVIDVGGGSTELVWGDDSGIDGHASVDIGSVRLTEAHIKSDPPTEDELAAVVESTSRALSPIFVKIDVRSISKAIAVAGTATTLAAIKHKLELYDPNIVHGSTLTKDDIERMIELFKSLKTAERALIPGLQSGRADVITAGALILRTTLIELRLAEFTVSERDILDGIVGSMLEKRKSICRGL